MEKTNQKCQDRLWHISPREDAKRPSLAICNAEKFGQLPMTIRTISLGFEAVKRSLTEFGYPDITIAQIKTAHSNWLVGDEPKDIIEKFAFGQFETYRDIFGEANARH